MNAETHAQRTQANLRHVPFAVTSTHRNVRVHEAYDTRSIRNITSWREFLPDDCVTAMIKMGWDRTT
jgi:hypothetical protein